MDPVLLGVGAAGERLRAALTDNDGGLLGGNIDRGATVR